MALLTHGVNPCFRRTALAELLFGSVTNSVAHHCSKPVIVLHCTDTEAVAKEGS